MSYRILILIGVVAALVGFFFMYSSYQWPGSDAVWAIRAEAPRVIGGYSDNFCYDGQGVRSLAGSLTLSIASDGTGSIDASVSTTDSSGPLHLASSDELAGTIRIKSRIDDSSELEEELDINGDIQSGDSGFPQTHATLTGKSTFDLYVDGELRYEALRGEWSVADAVRQSDGSIRQSGLLYSPLLRDKSGFSDPGRLEFTLLLHSDEPDPNNDPQYSIVLHLVFSDVTIEKQPSTS
ncbi:MAG: hypothetical protein U9Q94_00475 [Candidatus Bipolaricaulota bacterium]|nr:hypothetical protein [Candidatus Bipolaricaulota bacterium]